MERVVCHAIDVEPELVARALPDADVIAVYDQLALVEALVERKDIAGAVIEIGVNTAQWDAFLASVERSFPLLPVAILAPGAAEGSGRIDTVTSDDRIAAAIAALFAHRARRERRVHHRYEWPLLARLERNQTEHRVHEISAGGALLEPVSPIPNPGAACEIEIEFQNFRMKTSCEILDPRHTSSRSRSGFGVRFTSLSEQGEAFIDQIVHDALARVLLDPDASPAIPSIDESERILTVGDEFSLSL